MVGHTVRWGELRLSALRYSVVGLLCASASAALAQAPPDLTKVPADKAEGLATPGANKPAKGIAVGPFTVDATADAGELFSDNIYVTKNSKQSDWITTIGSNLTASLVDGSNELNLRGGANVGRYARFSKEDYDDYYVGGDGRLRIDTVTSLFAGARYDWTHESRESPDAVNGITPTAYRTGDYYAGLLRSFVDFVLRVGATATTYSFDNVASTSGMIDNTDRNRTQYEAGARLSYRYSRDLLPFLQAYWDSRDYDRSIDDFGYRRSSDGYRIAAGVSGSVLPSLTGEVYAGVIGQHYDDTRLHSLTEPDFGLRLKWQPTALTNVTGFIDRTIEETDLVGASGYIRTAIGAALSQEVRPDLYANAHFYYSENAYQNVDRVDDVSDAGLGIKYFLARNVYLAMDYAFLHRVSNTAPADFYENRIWFRLGLQAAPAYQSDPKTFAAVRDEVAPGGFYIGLLTGNGTLTSAVNGPRGGSGEAAGTLIADFGGNGWEGDLAGGYGVMIGRVYLGAELDAALDSQNWLHNGTQGTRIFGVRKFENYEAAARIGYQLESRALLYGRFGLVDARFGSLYVHGSHTVHPSDYERGLRFGGGIEFPLDGQLSGRVEYTQTAYADYGVKAGGPPGSGPDNFANSENLVRFGVIYHIDAARADNAAPAFDYQGFYAGLQGGFGALISQNAGDRNNGHTLDAQRAGTGAGGGIFGGYGLTQGPIYLGVEGNADVSNTDWNIERDPTGRIYSVAQDYTLGASLLAGYVVNGNTLIYGRVGAADTRFQTKYHDEGGVNYVTPATTKLGLRLGGGVTTPVSSNAYLRFDYTWTRYGTYRVNYVTGIDTFRNSQNVFMIGIAWKL